MRELKEWFKKRGFVEVESGKLKLKEIKQVGNSLFVKSKMRTLEEFVFDEDKEGFSFMESYNEYGE